VVRRDVSRRSGRLIQSDEQGATDPERLEEIERTL